MSQQPPTSNETKKSSSSKPQKKKSKPTPHKQPTIQSKKYIETRLNVLNQLQQTDDVDPIFAKKHPIDSDMLHSIATYTTTTTPNIINDENEDDDMELDLGPLHHIPEPSAEHVEMYKTPIDMSNETEIHLFTCAKHIDEVLKENAIKKTPLVAPIVEKISTNSPVQFTVGELLDGFKNRNITQADIEDQLYITPETALLIKDMLELNHSTGCKPYTGDNALEIAKVSYIATFLREPVAPGERQCAADKECVGMKFFSWELPKSKKMIHRTFREFLTPSQTEIYGKIKQLPNVRQYCLLCIRYQKAMNGFMEDRMSMPCIIKHNCAANVLDGYKLDSLNKKYLQETGNTLRYFCVKDYIPWIYKKEVTEENKNKQKNNCESDQYVFGLRENPSFFYYPDFSFSPVSFSSSENNILCTRKTPYMISVSKIQHHDEYIYTNILLNVQSQMLNSNGSMLNIYWLFFLFYDFGYVCTHISLLLQRMDCVPSLELFCDTVDKQYPRILNEVYITHRKEFILWASTIHDTYEQEAIQNRRNFIIPDPKIEENKIQHIDTGPTPEKKTLEGSFLSELYGLSQKIKFRLPIPLHYNIIATYSLYIEDVLLDFTTTITPLKKESKKKKDMAKQTSPESEPSPKKAKTILAGNGKHNTLELYIDRLSERFFPLILTIKDMIAKWMPVYDYILVGEKAASEGKFDNWQLYDKNPFGTVVPKTTSHDDYLNFSVTGKIYIYPAPYQEIDSYISLLHIKNQVSTYTKQNYNLEFDQVCCPFEVTLQQVRTKAYTSTINTLWKRMRYFKNIISKHQVKKFKNLHTYELHTVITTCFIRVSALEQLYLKYEKILDSCHKTNPNYEYYEKLLYEIFKFISTHYKLMCLIATSPVDMLQDTVLMEKKASIFRPDDILIENTILNSVYPHPRATCTEDDIVDYSNELQYINLFTDNDGKTICSIVIYALSKTGIPRCCSNRDFSSVVSSKIENKELRSFLIQIFTIHMIGAYKHAKFRLPIKNAIEVLLYIRKLDQNSAKFIDSIKHLEMLWSICCAEHMLLLLKKVPQVEYVLDQLCDTWLDKYKEYIYKSLSKTRKNFCKKVKNIHTSSRSIQKIQKKLVKNKWSNIYRCFQTTFPHYVLAYMARMDIALHNFNHHIPPEYELSNKMKKGSIRNFVTIRKYLTHKSSIIMPSYDEQYLFDLQILKLMNIPEDVYELFQTLHSYYEQRKPPNAVFRLLMQFPCMWYMYIGQYYATIISDNILNTYEINSRKYDYTVLRALLKAYGVAEPYSLSSLATLFVYTNCCKMISTQLLNLGAPVTLSGYSVKLCTHRLDGRGTCSGSTPSKEKHIRLKAEQQRPAGRITSRTKRETCVIIDNEVVSFAPKKRSHASMKKQKKSVRVKDDVSDEYDIGLQEDDDIQDDNTAAVNFNELKTNSIKDLPLRLSKLVFNGRPLLPNPQYAIRAVVNVCNKTPLQSIQGFGVSIDPDVYIKGPKDKTQSRKIHCRILQCCGSWSREFPELHGLNGIECLICSVRNGACHEDRLCVSCNMYTTITKAADTIGTAFSRQKGQYTFRVFDDLYYTNQPQNICLCTQCYKAVMNTFVKDDIAKLQLHPGIVPMYNFSQFKSKLIESRTHSVAKTWFLHNHKKKYISRKNR